MMMKKNWLLFVALLPLVAAAQTVNVQTGQVTYAYPAEQVGDMTYTDATALTVLERTFNIGDISQVYIDESEVVDNTVSVSYGGASASVRVAGNVARYLSISVSGAHVAIEQSDDLPSEITYTLTGTSSDGEFYMDGSLKATLELSGLTLTNPSGPAINIQNGKRIAVSVKKDTENTLRDGSGGDWKGCLRCKGHLELKGKGVLNVYGNTAHAIWSKEYVEMKNCTVNVLKAVGDGINANQYFLMESGALSISGVGDDGIQVSFKTDDNDQIEIDDENTGALTVAGGTLAVSTTAVGTKGLKAEGPLLVSEGSTATSLTVKNSGNVDATDTSDPTSSACMKSDKSITISGGTLTLTNTGQGGRAINCEGTIDITGGVINARAEGSNYGSSSGGGGGGWGPGGGGRPGGGGSTSNGKNAKGIKSKGNLTVSGGSLTVYSANHEALESKAAMTISGGTVYSQAKDDAVNSSGNMTISGGVVYAYSTSNDGLDANGNMTIEGGVAIAFGGSGAEAGIDIDEQHSLSITGGQVFGIGGRVDARFGTSTQSYGYTSSSASFSGSYIVLADSNQTPIFAVKTPKSSCSGICLVSSPSMQKGSGYQLGTATTVSGSETNNFWESPTVSGFTRKSSFNGR